MSYILPIGIALLLLYALFRRINVFSAFANGAAESLPLLVKILPHLATMLIAIRVFRDSGALDWLVQKLSPILSHIGVDARLVPLILLRPLSGSAALAVLSDLFQTEGPDSFVGYTASVLLGASETIFYTLALYFGSIGVKKTRFTLPVALIATLVSVVTGILFSHWFY